MKTHIVIHHSFSPDRDILDWQGIRNYHVNDLGWSDIGYHWGIELVNGIPEVIMGRDPSRPGAHAKELDFNRKSFGICVVGNFDQAAPPWEVLTRLKKVCFWLMAAYDIPPGNVLGHRDVGLLAGYDWQAGQYKTCPGRLFPLDEFKASLV